MVQAELHSWRVAVKCRNWPHAVYGPEAIISDGIIDLLSSVGPISTQAGLTKVLSGQYQRYNEYGDELWGKISSLDIPAMVELPKKPRKQAVK
jgi:hypothetical protein